MAKTTRQLYLKDRDAWRAWLEKHHGTEKEIWLIYYKKHTGKARIPYDDAVEEALCFGWIDSTVKRLDDERYMQKYTPRKGKSMWSKLNKQRALNMIREGRMTEAGLAKIKEAKRNGEWARAHSEDHPAPMPPELKKALAANKRAGENFKNLAPSYRKQFIGWLASAKRDETRLKRVREIIRLVSQNKKLGMR